MYWNATEDSMYTTLYIVHTMQPGASWRSVETFAVLGARTVIGILLAPALLRRMARRQSGSTLAKVRERIISKGY